MSLYLGENLVSGVTTTVDKSERIGQIIQSTIPLTDAGLHLLDGALINGSGSYSAFVDYISNLYSNASKHSNINVIGTLSDNNGVISGFGQSNYATVPFNVSLGSNFELQIKLTTGALTSSQQHFISGKTNQYISIAINASNNLSFNIGNGSSWLSPTMTDNSISANTTYWFKITFNGSRYALLKSTNGTSFSEVGYLNSSSVIPTFLMQFGVTRDINTDIFQGSIDLNDCYIDIDGSRVWDGRLAVGFTNESVWQSSVTNYGVCGKFVYDSTNNTVRLPKITGIIEGTTDVTALGDLIEAGLPNITGKFTENTASYNVQAYGEGAFAKKPLGVTGSVISFTSGTNYAQGYIDFDASRSSSVYGNSSTVQPQAIKVFYYIVIATSTKTDIQVDIDEIATDLNGKADVDLENCTTGAFENVIALAQTTGKEAINGWGMPDFTAGISKAWATAHLADKDYFVVVVGFGSSSMDCYNLSVSQDGVNWTYIASYYSGSGGNGHASNFIPKGMYYRGSSGTSNQSLTVYPLKGEN